MPDTEYRIRELERRMGRVEDSSAVLPVIQRDVAEISKDIEEVKEDTRALRRALYTVALSIMGGSVAFAFSVFELTK